MTFLSKKNNVYKTLFKKSGQHHSIFQKY